MVSLYTVTVTHPENDHEKTTEQYKFVGVSGMGVSDVITYMTKLLQTLYGLDPHDYYISPIYEEQPKGKYIATIDLTTLINNAELKEIE